MKFEGKITGVRLFDSIMPSSISLSGHLDDVHCDIDIHVNREKARGIVQDYGVDDKLYRMSLGEKGGENDSHA